MPKAACWLIGRELLGSFQSKSQNSCRARQTFVCPNSAVRDVKKVIDRPSLVADFVIDNCDAYCLNDISTTPCPLMPAIMTAIRGYTFENMELWKASELVEKPQMRAVLHEHLDIDPGEALRVRVADVPEDVADEESA